MTAKIRSATQGILDALDVLSYFDLLVTADDMQRMKPDPHGIQIVLDEFGVNNPLNAVIVGDMATDIQAGRAAGIRTVAVTYGYGPRAELISASADALIDSNSAGLGSPRSPARRRRSGSGPKWLVQRIILHAAVAEGVLLDRRRTSSTAWVASFTTWNASRTAVASASWSSIAFL